MTHCDHHDHEPAANWRLGAAFAVISVFMVVEIVGALVSGSLALLADAAHMFTDAFALGLALVAQKIAALPADGRLHFGYRRAQVLAGFANGVLLLALIAWIAIEAVRRLMVNVEIDWRPMLWVAILGFIANVFAFWLLHRADQTNVNVRGAVLHVLSDLLGSVAAIVSALAIRAGAPASIDALLSLLVAGLIGASAIRLVRQTGMILLEGSPAHLTPDAVRQAVLDHAPGVVDVHAIRIWEMTPGDIRLNMHLRVDKLADGQAALDFAKSVLKKRFHIDDSTIQVETRDDCPHNIQEIPAPRMQTADVIGTLLKWVEKDSESPFHGRGGASEHAPHQHGPGCLHEHEEGRSGSSAAPRFACPK